MFTQVLGRPGPRPVGVGQLGCRATEQAPVPPAPPGLPLQRPHTRLGTRAQKFKACLRLSGHLARDPFAVCLAPPAGPVSLGSVIPPLWLRHLAPPPAPQDKDSSCLTFIT